MGRELNVLSHDDRAHAEEAKGLHQFRYQSRYDYDTTIVKPLSHRFILLDAVLRSNTMGLALKKLFAFSYAPVRK
jgi:hypothetical protein